MNKDHILNFTEIEAELLKLKEMGKGKMELQVLGHSHEGRPLYAAVIGNGDIRIWMQGRLHGNEPYGAEACLEILGTLVAGDRNAEAVLSKITFMVIPCYNPDGSERNQRGNALGADLNRQWGHLAIFNEMASEWGIEVPPIAGELFMSSVESQHYWYAWASFKPHYIIDYHHEHQNYYTSDATNELATVIIFTPGNPTFHIKQGRAISRENSQLAMVAFEAVQKLNYCKPTRYPIPEQNFPQGMGAGATVGVPGPKGEDSGWASSCVFFENMPVVNGPLGRDDAVGQFVVGGWGVIDAIVSGKLNEADPMRFWDEKHVPVVLKTGENREIRWTTPEYRGKNLKYGKFNSLAVQTDVSYHIFLPDAYTTKQEQRFPVIYWLHGTGGGETGERIEWLSNYFYDAIGEGKISPMIVVFPYGMKDSMWLNSKDGAIPMETVFVKELIPHIDAKYRTLATREGRLIEGFSMGGYGSARLGFKFHEIFGALSMLGAGPVQEKLVETPLVTPEEREELLKRIYGGEMDYFIEVSPRKLAEENVAALRHNAIIRIVVGDMDKTYKHNCGFHEYLKQLEIPHNFMVLPDIEHDSLKYYQAMGEDNWDFYNLVFRECV